eukprot:TRINITY_DN1540_c0_g1_i1.p1 TRINITY_DN1540_c0_g1~~TRINITY_DN1540_c0_g1_i1.p1  ORF type:complete len:182 (+),score=38.15 TRINITY_DN1540_c0_g1_i1:49-594(+)
MQIDEKINPNPIVFAVSAKRVSHASITRNHAQRRIGYAFTADFTRIDDGDETLHDDDPFTAEEIFEYIRDIKDPEHPYSLEQLNVVRTELIAIEGKDLCVQFTPTVPHCSMSTLIGLCIRVKLLRSLPFGFKIRVLVSPGSHSSEESLNKQLNDKERIAAALENPPLVNVVNQCLTALVGH